ncbi:MAG: polar growth protein [Bogoriella megaspora]|nr:MAG: polar growth protein [Bogoriella megaspora]
MAARQTARSVPGDSLLVVPQSNQTPQSTETRFYLSKLVNRWLVVDDFIARSPDELSLSKGDRVELIERDDDFGDGWFLGRHLANGQTGLFPEVYTTPAPRPTLPNAANQRRVSEGRSRSETNGQAQQESVATTPNSAFQAPQTVNGTHLADSIVETGTRSSGNANPVRSASTPIVHSSGMRTSPASARSLAIDGGLDNSVMNETLHVINEHITDMHTPRHSMVPQQRRATTDSGSEYSNSNVGHRLSYINGQETDEEESNLHSEAEVTKWTAEQVAEYLEDVGVERRHCDVFREQEITGEVLLGMDQSSVFIKEFDLGPVGRRLRTWHKVKALQEEVRGNQQKLARSVASMSEYSAGDDAQDLANRNRSTSVGTVLPRIPSITERPASRPVSRPVSRTQSIHTESTPSLAPSLAPSSQLGRNSPIPSMTTPSVHETSSRPSAASIRQMGHNRRHSSIDNTAMPIKQFLPETSLSASPTRMTHRKIPSFDKGWGLISPPAQQSARPASSAYGHSLSTDGTQHDNPNLTVVTPWELEKGYFSGSEVDARPVKGRNVLRKNQSATHSRDSSYDARRQSIAPKPHMRASSTESIQVQSGSPMSPAAKHYYSAINRANRAASGPDPRTAPFASPKDMPPTVTKLEFTDSPSIDAIANSPALGSGGGSEESSLVSPSQGQHQTGSKFKGPGIRTISDAVTGDEKLMAVTDRPPVSPIKESPVSPTHTDSTTPSGTSLDASEAPIRQSIAPSTTTTTSSSSRRRSKKTTSAYTRGLAKKTPQEQMMDCDYSGWMKKKSSNLMTTWKTRLFVLKGRRLSYYYSETDKEEKGLIDISSHRVLPADQERLTGLHATITGATASPTSPQNATTPTAASIDAEKAASAAASPTTPGTNGVATNKDPPGIFIFKLVPPRSGLSKAVNFTKPTVHYFAVDNIQQGRLWMAALMKATIDRDESKNVVTTYQQKTISLFRARAMKQRPPALMEPEEREPVSPIEEIPPDLPPDIGLNIHGLSEDASKERSEKDSGVAGMDKQKRSSESATGAPLLPTPESSGLSNGFFGEVSASSNPVTTGVQEA